MFHLSISWSSDQHFLFVGGKGPRIKADNILRFDKVRHTWSKVGKMKQERDHHAVSIVNADDVMNYCI